MTIGSTPLPTRTPSVSSDTTQRVDIETHEETLENVAAALRGDLKRS